MGTFFKNRKVTRPEFNLLPAGEHVVRVVRAEETNSFAQLSGEEKPELPAWGDATPQLAVTFVAAEEGKSGGHTNRFNDRGFLRMSELTKEQIASGNYQDENGYACSLNEDNVLVREISEKHTASCDNILMQFAASLGIKEGTDLEKGIQKAIDSQAKMIITIVNKPYGGKDQLRIEKFKAYSAPVVVRFDE